MNNVNSTRTTLYPSTCPSEVGVSAVSLEGHPLLPIKRYWSSFRRHHSKSEVAKDKNMTTRTNRLGFVPTLLLLLIIQWETFPRVSSGTVAHSHPNGNSVGVGESGSGESKNETGTGTGWTGTTKDKGHRRQGRDYSPPSAGAQQQYMSPPIQHSPAYAAPIPAYAPPQTSYGSPPASSYGSPAQPIMMQSGYGVPSMGHYAIPPIVMGSGGYGDYGMDDEGGGGGGHGGSELIGLLGLKGLKGLKGVKAAKAVKGLGLLAFAPILLPLLFLAPILLPALLLLPLLLPLLILFFVPIPVITLPGRRKKRSTTLGVRGPRSIFEDTLTSLVSNLPPSLSNIPPEQLSGCLDTFVCQTGDLVQRTAPSLMGPAAWLLTSLWPSDMHHKVKIFETAAKCGEQYKCRVKKLEDLFNNVVFRESVKLKNRIQEKVGERKSVGWKDLIRIIFE